MADINADLDRALADGRITLDDATEVQRFAAFLEEAGPASDKARGAAAWKKHYPEDYTKALADYQARQGKTDTKEDT
jgi:hypothetical protein